MADGGLAVAAVLTSGVVGALGVIVPALTARGNREHDERLREADRRRAEEDRVWDRRAAVYEEMIASAVALEVAARSKADHEMPSGDTAALQGRLYAWSSRPVQQLWADLVAEIRVPAGAAFALDDIDADKVTEKTDALIDRINEELTHPRP